VTASPAPKQSRRVIGLGNPDRGDDGVGPAVAAALGALLPADITVETSPGDATDLLDRFRDAHAVILIDAMLSGRSAGFVLRLDVTAGDPLPPQAATSSHGLGLAEAIGLARALGCLPPVCVVYAIEAAGFDPGAPLSPPVAAALPDLARRIAADPALTRPPTH
jgi:hydrogenase maturation protease